MLLPILAGVNVGFWAILPPIIAIVLALITKEVISSLIVGILSGALIYNIAIGGNALVGTIETTFNVMASNVSMMILIFLSLLGALVILVSKSGGAQAYGRWATKKIKSRRSSLIATIVLGILIFIDDYFNCLTIGTVMKPVTDKYQVSRAKLAYVIDSTAAPVCIISPISSWAAAVGSALLVAGGFDSPLMAFISTIPFNLYAILSIIMVFVIALSNLHFGPMYKAEELALTKGDLGAIDVNEDVQVDTSEKGHVYDMVLPVVALIIFSILAMLYTGNFFTPGTEGYLNLFEAIGGCDSSLSLVIGGFGALVFTFILYIPRKVVSFKGFMESITEGTKSMVPADLILILAWTISGICGEEFLNTGAYVVSLVTSSNISLVILPAIIFAVAAFLSFSMGTAWGTFGILILIIVPIFQATPEGQSLLIMALGATLAGSVFGDHCSPISDTTILSSTGAGCNHIQHVSTQIPYCIAVASCCFIGYLVGGLFKGNVWVTLLTGIACLVIFLVTIAYIIPFIQKKKIKKN